MELHIFVEEFAKVTEAYLHMAHAMDEIKKFLFPVSAPSLSHMVVSKVYILVIATGDFY